MLNVSLASLLIATGCAKEFSMQNYEKSLDMRAIKSNQIIQAVTESQTSLTFVQTANPLMIRENTLPISPEVLGFSLAAENANMVPILSLEPSARVGKEFSEMTLEDWGYFISGFFLGSFTTLATTGLAAIFNPCITMWSYIVLSSYSFYVYMIVYEEEGFSDNSYAAMMVLSMIQLMQALSMEGCNKEENHGFNNTGYSSGDHLLFKNVFTIDIEKLTRGDSQDFPAMDYMSYMSSWLSVFAQEMTSE